MNITEIPLTLIEEDRTQPRYQFDEEALQELMRSIEELGLLSPIKVRAIEGGRYMIIYGNRRYKAFQSLGKASIPCIISQATNETDIYLEQIAENLTREGFSPIEEAEAFHKLLHDPKFSCSTKFLSSKLGKPESYIKNKIELLKFSNAVKRLIVSGTEIRKDKLTEDQLKPLKDLPMEHRDSLALIVAKDELPVSDVKRIARLFKDSSISAGTKDKLLYKSGRDLLETWYVYEQNKAERAKPASKEKAAAAQAASQGAPAAAAASVPAANSADAAGSAHSVEPARAEHGNAGPGFAAAATGLSGLADAASSAAIAATPAAATAASSADAAPASASGELASGAAANGDIWIEQLLHQLLQALPPHQPISAEALQAYNAITELERASFNSGVELLITTLERHLEEWKQVRDYIAAEK